jgi:hypothetical protein
MHTPALHEIECCPNPSVKPKSSRVGRMGTLSDRILSQSIPLDYFESSDARGVEIHHLVPTHGDLGTHRDLVDFRTMMADVRESVAAVGGTYLGF